MLLAVFTLTLSESEPNCGTWCTLLLILGAMRVFEIFFFQNRQLFYRERNRGNAYHTFGARRLVLLAILNYAEVWLWYAVFYVQLADSFRSTSTSELTPTKASSSHELS